MMAKYPLLNSENCDEIIVALEGEKWNKRLELLMTDSTVADRANHWIVSQIMECEFLSNRILLKRLGLSRFTLRDQSVKRLKNAVPAFVNCGPDSSDIRTDVSITIFLTDPDSYEGGELVLDYPSGAMMYLKEPKGTMVFHPSGVIHHVRPVTSGKRICFEAWGESIIQDPQRRDIVSQAMLLCDDIETMSEDCDCVRTLRPVANNITQNLMRLWTDKT